MADGKVTVDLEVTGAAESAADVRRLQSSLRQYGSAARQAGTQADGLTGSLRVNAQQAAAATNQTGQMAGALGNVGAVISTLNPQAGALASQLGALGTAVSATSTSFGALGGAIGAVTLVIGAAVVAYQALRSEQVRVQSELRTTNSDLERQIQLLQEVANREALAERVARGGGTALEQAGERERLDVAAAASRRRLQELQRRAARLRQAAEAPRYVIGPGGAPIMQPGAGGGDALARVQAQIRSEEATLRSVQTRLQEARAQATEAERREALARAAGKTAQNPTSTGGGGGRARASGQPDDLTFKEVSNFEFLQAQEEERARLAEERRRREAEAERSLADEMEAMRQELFDASTERWRVEMARREDLAEKEQENLAYQIEQQREASEQLRADAEGVLAPAVSGLTGAISEIVAGTKSADEAFQGLLSSFLSMIAERAALEAAANFAGAIADAASFNFGGAAGKVAAGVAWTAVAVAAGGAAIATQPQVDNAPREPESTGGGGGGGTVVVNWNSPIVTATTRAELGRDLGQLGREGDRRLGVSR
jgi:hypothetical protein